MTYFRYNKEKKGSKMRVEFGNFFIEVGNKHEIRELEEAKRVLEKHGLRAVKKTADTSKKRASAAKANEAKQAKTREKLQNGLNLWRLEASDKKLTAYKLAQLAGVSKNTAKKFLEGIKAV